MPRESDVAEVTRTIRIRAPKAVMRKLERFTPAELGAWIVRIDRYMQEHAPEYSLEHWTASKLKRQPINSRLEELLRTAKPVTEQDLQFMKNALEFTEEERAVDEKFWRDRAEEKRLERESEL
jgi:hypothetical protein